MQAGFKFAHEHGYSYMVQVDGDGQHHPGEIRKLFDAMAADRVDMITMDRNYNVGTGVKTTINELVDALLEITGSDLEPEYRPQDQMFVTHRVGSTENAERDLGFGAEIPYEEGLRSVVEWRHSDERRAVPEQA